MEQEFYDKDAIHYVVLGCPHAGKTTLIKQLAGEDSELVLFGDAMSIFHCLLNEQNTYFWNITDIEHAVCDDLFKKATRILICYDTTDATSYANTTITFAQYMSNEKLIVVGTKVDLKEYDNAKPDLPAKVKSIQVGVSPDESDVIGYNELHLLLMSTDLVLDQKVDEPKAPMNIEPSSSAEVVADKQDSPDITLMNKQAEELSFEEPLQQSKDVKNAHVELEASNTVWTKDSDTLEKSLSLENVAQEDWIPPPIDINPPGAPSSVISSILSNESPKSPAKRHIYLYDDPSCSSSRPTLNCVSAMERQRIELQRRIESQKKKTYHRHTRSSSIHLEKDNLKFNKALQQVENEKTTIDQAICPLDNDSRLLHGTVSSDKKYGRKRVPLPLPAFYASLTRPIPTIKSERASHTFTVDLVLEDGRVTPLTIKRGEKFLSKAAMIVKSKPKIFRPQIQAQVIPLLANQLQQNDRPPSVTIPSSYTPKPIQKITAMLSVQFNPSKSEKLLLHEKEDIRAAVAKFQSTCSTFLSEKDSVSVDLLQRRLHMLTQRTKASEASIPTATIKLYGPKA